jgi:hypothetical protein
VLRLLVTANVVPSSLILVTLMMEAVRSSETQHYDEIADVEEKSAEPPGTSHSDYGNRVHWMLDLFK